MSAYEVEHVENAVEEHAVVLEGKGALGRDALEDRQSPRERRAAERLDEAADPLELFGAGGRIPGEHLVERRRLGSGEIDALEQLVHGVADLARRETAPAGDAAAPVDGPESREPLGVEAVRAALEQRERAVGEPTHALGRNDDRLERRQQWHDGRRRLGRGLEEGELALLGQLRRGDFDLRLVAVDPQPEPRLIPHDLAALELLDFEPVQDPSDRRACVTLFGVDGAGNDQLVDRAGHRHVVEAQPFRLVGRQLRVAHLVVRERRLPPTRRRIGDLEAEAAVRETDDLLAGRLRPLPARIGDDDHLELEPLGRVDRQQPDGTRSFLLRDRLQLLDPRRVLLEHEADEALDVRAAQLLVGTREPRELAQVGVAAAPVPLREHREVVVVLDEDLLAETFEPDGPRNRSQPVVALTEGLQQPPIALRQPGGETLFEPGEKGPLRRRAPQQHERVVGDADERRGQHGDERLVVVPVVQEAQVREEVAHLLLAEVSAARRPVGRQAGGAQLLLVLLGIRPGSEEDDDLARLRLTGVDELLHPSRDGLRLASAPAVRCVLVARLVGDEQLDRRSARRIGEPPRGDEPLELVAESRRELVEWTPPSEGPPQRLRITEKGNRRLGEIDPAAIRVDARNVCP